MGTVTAKQLKQRTGEVIRRVKWGERLTVTFRGKPVAVIAQPTTEETETLKELRPLVQVLIQSAPVWSSSNPLIVLPLRLWGSSGSCLYNLKSLPSYLFRPSNVPNHKNPWLSRAMPQIASFESPFSVVRRPNLMYWLGGSPAGRRADAAPTADAKRGGWGEAIRHTR